MLENNEFRAIELIKKSIAQVRHIKGVSQKDNQLEIKLCNKIIDNLNKILFLFDNPNDEEDFMYDPLDEYNFNEYD